MFIVDKKQLVHLLSGCRDRFSKIFLLEIKKSYKKWCPFANHGPTVDKNCFLLHQYETGWVDHLKYFIFVIRYFSDDEEEIRNLSSLSENVANPDLNSTAKDFENNLDKLIYCVQEIENKIDKKLKNLTCLECERLGEAMACLESNCFAASAVMSASTIESRLHYILKKKDAKIYKQFFQRAPLGALVKLFDKNEYRDKKFNKLKKILPDRHKPLLGLINTYRILSAHPSSQDINYRIAEAIINLVIIFLLDPELKIGKKKLLKK